jgi:mutator protein MutT
MNKIVAMIICKDGKIIVEKRKMDKRTDPGKIIIPSGKVNEGEGNEQACKRELIEELDIRCEKFIFIAKFLHTEGTEKEEIYYYSCDNWKGEPKPLEAEEIFWIGKEELEKLSFEISRKALREFFRKTPKKPHQKLFK